MASRNLSNIFAGLSGIGFLLLWGVMNLNGGCDAMLKTAWTGVFPDGSLLKTTHSGIWPLDFQLNILIAFFSAASNLKDVDPGPYLMLLDLTTALLVINLMVLVESRRRSGFWLRSPALWQYLWNCGGVAVFLPIWALLYVKQRAAGTSRLSTSDSQALPLTAIVSVVLELPLLLPSCVGASPVTIQDGVVLFFLGPPIFSAFQALASRSIANRSWKGFSSPVKKAYYITAIISGVVHVGCVLYAIFSTNANMSLARVYWPHNDYAQSDQPNILIEAAFLFLQYDYIIINITVLILGTHILATKSGSKAGGNAAGSPLTLVGFTAMFGPGVGLAYAACYEEDRIDSGRAGSKYA